VEPDRLKIILCLFTAHLAADFLMQTENDIKHKNTSRVLLKHSSIHALLGYFLVGIFPWWEIPLSILVSHALIDRTKASSNNKGILVFLLDQAAHLSILVLIGLLLPAVRPERASVWMGWFGVDYYRFLLISAGAILVTRVGGILIGTAAAPYLRQLESARQEKSGSARTIDPLGRGFDNGGYMIGLLERSLIYIFVLINQPAAIAILITAKSLFRFGEIKDRSNRMEAEYILIGTLMSFLFALAVSCSVRLVLPLL
jgi:hypothetical protein